MELMLRDGDYVPDGRGGFQRVEGAQEVLQRVLWKLSVRRGSFPLLPGLGSRLYLLPREKPSVRAAMARQYAAEALADEPDLTVTGAAWGREDADGCDLAVFLEWRGESLRADVRV
ncbi:hypothetical protein CE91St41_06520 [Oscillospiraceae bacterium]|nr:hypothetical protein CE91St40_06520 [Oscillospiraceae bacterium]BDF73763.1 hypothetical protein CE91St41_06520 [Oscillospiraceae bacterium]